MKEIIKYVTSDGSEFNDKDKAQRHEQMCDEVANAMLWIGDIPDSFDGYYQHTESDFNAAKSALLQVIKKYYNGFEEYDDSYHPGSILGRVVNDSCHGVIWRAWVRLMCFDAQYREWEQPYYAMNPGTGESVCLN